MLTATNMEEMSSNNGKKNSPSGTSLFEHEHSSWCQWSAAPVAPQQTKSISHSVVFANWPFQKISWCCFLRLFFLLISLRCEVSRRLVGWCWLVWVERGEEKNVWKATDRCGQLSRNKPSLRIPVSWNKSLTAWCWFVCVNRQRGMLNLRTFHQCTSLTDYDACTLWVRVCARVIIASWGLSGEISTSGSPWKAGTHSCTKTHSHERTRTVWHLGTLSNQHQEKPPLISALCSLTHTQRHTQTHTWGWALISYSLSTVSWRKQSTAY